MAANERPPFDRELTDLGLAKAPDAKKE